MLKRSSGIAMVEIMITMVITIIGLLGLGALQLKAGQTVQDTGSRSQATWVAEDLTNRIRANIVALDSYDTNGLRDSLGAPFNCPNAPLARCADSNDGSGRSDAAACTNDQMAVFDLWEVACASGVNVNGSDFTWSTSADYLPNPELTVDVTADDRVQIVISWDMRTAGQDAAGNAVYDTTDGNVAVSRSTYTTEFRP